MQTSISRSRRATASVVGRCGLAVALSAGLGTACSRDTALPSDIGIADSQPQDAESDAVADSAQDPTDDPSQDSTAETGGDVDSDTIDDTTVGPEDYVRVYDTASAFEAPDGMQWSRSIVHLHSTHSHDACDGEPRLEDGSYNLPCLASLRAALCQVRVDFAFLTDHREHFGETPWLDALLHDPAVDTIIEDLLGAPIANQFSCDDGHVVTVSAGMETDVMPVSFQRPMSEDVEENLALLDGADAEAVARFVEAGAFVWTAHTEQHDPQTLLDVGVTGVEIYNLHANIDPRIREEWLGLPGADVYNNILPFILGRTDTNPDLALLAFLSDNQPAMDAWSVMLDVRSTSGTAGTDAHENVLDDLMSDGERFDSYRRMMSWFSNYMLTADGSFEAVRESLRDGRTFVAFDTLGSPNGFDCALFANGDPGAARYEMGSTTTWTEGMRIVANIPSPDDAAIVTSRLLRTSGGTWSEVAAASSGGVDWALTEPGVYRVDVRVVPHHLVPFMDDMTALAALAETEFPWIYTNAFIVE